ncbi:MAG: hypothetical protein HZA50_01060 [Planctomycetes bacterium]|nr:hypothetical protein [Planctomycetota bacterium]
MTASPQPNDLREAMDRAADVYNSGDLVRAYKIFQKISRDFPCDPQSVFNMGVILDKRGDKEQAIQMMLQALQRNAAFGQARVNLAGLYYETGSLVEAAILAHESVDSGLEDWLGERMLKLRDLLETDLTGRLACRIEAVRSDQAAGSAIREIGQYVGALLGRKAENCEMVMRDGRRNFIVDLGEFVVSAHVRDGCLIIRDNITGESMFERELPASG